MGVFFGCHFCLFDGIEEENESDRLVEGREGEGGGLGREERGWWMSTVWELPRGCILRVESAGGGLKLLERGFR